jgi:hypothetical protein
MFNKIVSFTLILLVFTSCSDFDDEWSNAQFEGRRFNKLVVVGLSHELERREIYEEVGTTELAKYGITAVKGLSVFPQAITEAHDTDSLTKLIIANNIDAVIVVKILHEDDHTYLMPDDQKRFAAYYGRWGRTKSVNMARRYYQQPDDYFMIATLYDLHEKHEETAVWRATNLITNPDAKIATKKKFIRTAIKHLIKQQLIVVE